MRTIVIVMLMCSMCVAAPIGSPTATLEQGQASIGMDMSRQTQDVKVIGTGYFDGIVPEVKTNMISALIGYGVTERFEVYGRIGYTDIEDNQRERITGIGARATLAENVLVDGLDIGMTGQLNLSQLQTQGKIKYWCLSIPVDMDIDLMETIVAVGPSYALNGFTIYGGPAIYRLDGDIEAEAGWLPPFISVDDGSIKETTSIIGYVGGAWECLDNLNLTGELQFGSGFSNINLGAIWKF
jgi:hypothetical protein